MKEPSDGICGKCFTMVELPGKGFKVGNEENLGNEKTESRHLRI